MHAANCSRPRRWDQREAKSSTTSFIRCTIVPHLRWLLDGTGVHSLRPEAQGSESHCLRILACLNVPSSSTYYRPQRTIPVTDGHYSHSTHQSAHTVLPLPQSSHRVRCLDHPCHLVRCIGPYAEVLAAKRPGQILWATGRGRKRVGFRADSECGDAVLAGNERVSDISRGSAGNPRRVYEVEGSRVTAHLSYY
jgi:hypothetical protein